MKNDKLGSATEIVWRTKLKTEHTDLERLPFLNRTSRKMSQKQLSVLERMWLGVGVNIQRKDLCSSYNGKCGSRKSARPE